MTATESTAALGGAARTVLEQRIRDRKETFEEFISAAELFARKNDEEGTLSLRHLQRLVTGKSQAVRLRPATTRLLEHIFGDEIENLLSPPSPVAPTVTAHVLRVAIAVVVRASQVLVVSRREGAGDLPWQFPAGMVKPGVPSSAVAIAETLAETGVHCVHVRYLGTRLHPVTNVHCEYHHCDYVAGVASNLDASENSAVTWVETADLARLIAFEKIYPPILDVLGLTLLSGAR